jgi:hypothetical protein
MFPSEISLFSFVMVFLFKKLEEKEGWNERLVVTATIYFK